MIKILQCFVNREKYQVLKLKHDIIIVLYHAWNLLFIFELVDLHVLRCLHNFTLNAINSVI
jgi:hypothetical protein